ncbi:hypothetical protein [Streptomyces sp. F001]|uniref:hypothetical protein n=1 Tax=Streptomyces sp. F001 TaxID=1510026 RepID=UPI00101E5B5F|nr:hypothetical protein [Streptomyces sp. F001]
MLGKRSWGSIDYDVCRACQRVHIQHARVPAVMQGEGHEARMLRFARTKAPRGYRWTLGPGVDTSPFWTNVHGELDYTVERSCDHLRKKLPGTLEDLWGRLKWWRLTGQIWLPPTRADRKKRRKFLDALE